MSINPIPKGEIFEGSIVDKLDTRFFSSLDLLGNLNPTYTIDHLEYLETLRYGNGNTDKNVLLCYFKESPKPLKLNATNKKAIAEVLKTKLVKEWSGKQVTLEIQNISAFGKTRPAVRVRR